MAAKIDALLKAGTIAALLLASSGLGYYYAVYVPQERLLAQQQEQEQHQLAATAAAQVRYQACLSSAGAARAASWAAECKRLADKTEQDHADCLDKLNLPKTYCDASYPARDAAANCTLPDQVATVLNAALAQARNRCVREREAAAGQ